MRWCWKPPSMAVPRPWFAKEAAARMTKAIELARLHPNAKLVFTGGAANLVSPVIKIEADEREAESFERSQYSVGCAGNRAWRIDIFDTHQPFAAASAGVEIAANSRNE